MNSQISQIRGIVKPEPQPERGKPLSSNPYCRAGLIGGPDTASVILGACKEPGAEPQPPEGRLAFVSDFKLALGRSWCSTRPPQNFPFPAPPQPRHRQTKSSPVGLAVEAVLAFWSGAPRAMTRAS